MKVEDDNVEKKVFAYNNSGSFGELALMYKCPRAASVVATSDGVLWQVDRVTFRNVVINFTKNQRELHRSFLKKFPIFDNQPSEMLHKIADCITTVNYEDGERIIKEGDYGDKLFFVMSGKCAAELERDGKRVFLNDLNEGQYFGEVAMLSEGGLRSADVRAVGKVELAALNREAFVRLLSKGNVKEKMDLDMKLYKSPLSPSSAAGKKTRKEDGL